MNEEELADGITHILDIQAIQAKVLDSPIQVGVREFDKNPDRE